MRSQALRIVLALSASAASLPAAQVEFQLTTAEGANPQSQRAWYTAFTELKVDGLRIQNGGTPALRVDAAGSGPTARYTVHGQITARNDLLLPGARFAQGDRAGLARWIETLRANGPGGAGAAERLPYGLTREQWTAVERDLARTVASSTQGVERLTAVQTLLARLMLPSNPLPGDALAAFTPPDPVGEELKGMSYGTALAYLLRPVGLALEVRSAGGRPSYLVVPGKNSQEPWPVGMAPKKTEKETLPAWLELLNAEIDDIPLPEALAAVQERLAIPFLIDHNALAKHGLKPETVRVKLPEARQTYQRLLGRITAQARLKAELRVDEAQQPFVWITSQLP